MNKQDREGFEKLARAIEAQTEAMTVQAKAMEGLVESAPALLNLAEKSPAILELAEKSPVLVELGSNYEGARWVTKFLKWLGRLGAGIGIIALLGQYLSGPKL